MKIPLLLIALSTMATLSQAADNARSEATLVVYNSSDPLSQTMARYYALKRDIPSAQVVGLPCAVTEEISREEFDATLANPLRDLFYKNGWWKVENTAANDLVATQNRIRFIALVRGIPLKVTPRVLVPQGGPTPRPVPGAPTPTPTPKPPPPPPMERQESSVDTELAALGILAKPLEGPLPNPYFKSYTPILDAGLTPIMLVTRLDGPNLMTVRNMVEDSLAAERDGVGGVAYFDTRDLQGGNYRQGDDWIRKAASDFRRNGIPTILDFRPKTLPAGYPLKRVGYYFGWYSAHVDGPFADPALKFRKGAVAVHIHSFSAATIRNPTQYWCAPLLERGAAATLGNVYEPYLDLTPHLDVFADRLLAGFTFAEASYMSMKSLSWMTTAIGDPLYRPFARWTELAADGEANQEMKEWDEYRSATLEWSRGDMAELPTLPKDPAQRGTWLESIATALHAYGQTAKAIKVQREAEGTFPDPEDAARAAFHMAQYVLKTEGKPAAIAYLQQAMKTYDGLPAAAALTAYELELNPPPPPPTPDPSATPGG